MQFGQTGRGPYSLGSVDAVHSSDHPSKRQLRLKFHGRCSCVRWNCRALITVINAAVNPWPVMQYTDMPLVMRSWFDVKRFVSAAFCQTVAGDNRHRHGSLSAAGSSSGTNDLAPLLASRFRSWQCATVMSSSAAWVFRFGKSNFPLSHSAPISDPGRMGPGRPASLMWGPPRTGRDGYLIHCRLWGNSLPADR